MDGCGQHAQERDRGEHAGGVAPALLRGEHGPQALAAHDELADDRTGD